MMTWFTNLAAEIRWTVVAAISILVCGPFVTWAIASLSYFGQRISPWSIDKTIGAKTLRPIHYVPLVGWIFRRRQSEEWPAHFWIRPLLLEIAVPLSICLLYWWETDRGLLPLNAINVSSVDVHWQFVGHFILLNLLFVATFIDFDEMLIPDSITIPGTLIALLGAAFIPQWHLYIDLARPGTVWPNQLYLTAPSELPTWIHRPAGLIVALVMIAGWCFALADRRIILRRGFAKAVRYFVAGLFRQSTWKVLLGIWAGTTAFVIACFLVLSPSGWESLYNSLAGIVIGGSIVWAVRLVASLALGMEALGFGDVILMGMVGAFLGWQPVAISFFFAPFFALVIVVVIALTTGNTATPFGPYLCAATVFCLVRWDAIWNQALQERFAMGRAVAFIFVFLFMLMGAMLFVWRLVKAKLFVDNA